MVAITDNEFAQLAGYIKRHYGIKLGTEKKALVHGRLTHYLDQHGFTSFAQYCDHVIGDRTGGASVELINMIATNHTFFMREVNHLHFLRREVLPFIAATAADHDLRIWSAGCSSGEEPYSLAMVIDEFLGPAKGNWDAKLLATDISEKALATARQGIYQAADLAALPPQWRVNYFRKLDPERSQVVDRLRGEVIFRRLNLMDERFFFKKQFQVIFCRNVMIYFDARTRRELVRRFYQVTAPGGYLFIGHSESLPREEIDYRYVLPAVYRKERS